MMAKFLPVLLLSSCLAGCGQNESPKKQEQSYGGRLGDSYKGMLDGARQGAGQVDDQMQRTEQAVRERD
jgi:hypothetical protein